MCWLGKCNTQSRNTVPVYWLRKYNPFIFDCNTSSHTEVPVYWLSKYNRLRFGFSKVPAHGLSTCDFVVGTTSLASLPAHLGSADKESARVSA